jgi:hypothetical protein
MSRDSHGRFKKGFCPNPKGRGLKTKRTLNTIRPEDEFIAATEEEFSVNVGGKPQKSPAIDLIYRQLIRRAAAGDVRCMLKVIELRETYSSKRMKERFALFREYLEARKAFERNPEDHTDEFRETLIATGLSFSDLF